MEQEKGDCSVLPRDRHLGGQNFQTKYGVVSKLPRNYKARGVFIHLYGTCG
jgi:hypothetical protein